VPLPHPLAGNDPELVAAKAAAIVGDLTEALVGDATAVAATHRERFLRLTQRRLESGQLCLDDTCALDLPATSAPA
jgi:hypothetical protein